MTVSYQAQSREEQCDFFDAGKITTSSNVSY